MLENITIADEYTNSIEIELREYFHESLTSKSAWDDRIWFFDRIKRSAGHADGDYKVYFVSVPERHLELVRFWTVLSMRNNKSCKTVSANVSHICRFLKFLVRECGDPKMSDVNRLTIEAYEDELREARDIKASSKEAMWGAVNNLFRDMLTWPQMPNKTPVPPGNPFNRRELDRKHASRLVPDMVLEQLDAAYRDERLPLEDRLTYWILRSIPSRVGEVCSIKLDCLRPYSYNNRQGFILTIPDFKQSANQHRPRTKLIHILDEGHGKFLLDMVREQRTVAEGLQGTLSDASRGYLMVSPRKRYIESMLTGGRAAEDRDDIGQATVLTGHLVRKRMKTVSDYFEVTGPDRKPYDAISHCFRHNGITERLYEGFTYVEIRDMSGHKGNQMLTTAYAHTKEEEIKARAKEKREKCEQGPPVLFQGRIMNMSPEMEEKLLRNPRAYRIGDLGICSDITSCGNDLFECLDCDYLVPDADNEEYYIAEIERWSARVVKHTKSGNTSLAEHASYMANLHEKQLDRIRLSLEMRSEEVSNGN